MILNKYTQEEINISNKYTSRSQVEDMHKCPRHRWYRQFYPVNGEPKGITPVRKSIPLSTGTCIHNGVEYLFRWAKENLNQNGVAPTESLEYGAAIQNAVTAATKTYYDLVYAAGFTGKGVTNDIDQKYTYNEQLALTEALIRAWAMKELPSIVAEYEIIGTEKEITIPLPGTDIIFQARVDAELRHRIDGSYYNYSLKTAKMWNDRSDKTYRKDLQGLTEIWAVENEREGLKGNVALILDGLEDLRRKGHIQQTNIDSITKFLSAKLPTFGKVVDAVKFCFLLKGDRRESGKDFSYYDPGDGSGRYVTYNPLIRGYKRISTMSIEYAHSYKFPNPNNKSGMGALGKGWEPFNVWEDKGVNGVSGWMQMLSEKDSEGRYVIQPECGDIIRNQVISPIPYMRNEQEVASAIRQLTHQEQRAFLGRDLVIDSMKDSDPLPYLDEHFPQYTHSCHWPSDCENLDICWNPQVREDPIGNGLYQIRMPHHEAEREGLG